MKKCIPTLLIIIILAAAFCYVKFYRARNKTIATIEKVTDYSDYNLYTMGVRYDYDIDRIVSRGITDTESCLDAIVKEAFPLIPIKVEVPSFGCSAFTMKCADGTVLMGRNYDFKLNTSAMMVRCAPTKGYKSIAFCALDNISADDALKNNKTKLACLTAPFVCLDGVNEKGVSIAVLTLDSEPTVQHNDKPAIGTTLAIRLVLDRAATTAEAVELLSEYDMVSVNGRDSHFYITDATGDGRVIEYDPLSEDRKMIVTPSDAITNFYACYKDNVLPNQHNGIYGHGLERYNRILDVFAKYDGNLSEEAAWTALTAASQVPNPDEVTSNTQWSIVFSNTNATAKIALRRDWGNVNFFSVK